MQMRRPPAPGRYPPAGLDEAVAGVLHELRRLDILLRGPNNAALADLPGTDGQLKSLKKRPEGLSKLDSANTGRRARKEAQRATALMPCIQCW